jgi:hypothetical protein
VLLASSRVDGCGSGFDASVVQYYPVVSIDIDSDGNLCAKRSLPLGQRPSAQNRRRLDNAAGEYRSVERSDAPRSIKLGSADCISATGDGQFLCPVYALCRLGDGFPFLPRLHPLTIDLPNHWKVIAKQQSQGRIVGIDNACDGRPRCNGIAQHFGG